MTEHGPDWSPPDVTVIIPVYDAMPYLRRCLDSVLAQSIGLDRLQVIAVDDGSTDEGGRLLDEVATRLPDTFVVLHQPNSGGPALPCNRGLERATGRWVFFLGADDHLSTTALERLVSQGDEWNSDVIFGTMQGENGRFVDQRIYRRSARDVSLTDSGLAYSLSNTKLFRRSLLERHQIRYALDLRVGSDQPFVVEALSRARRISVLNDQVYYYAVKRGDGSNITYSTDWRTRLDDLAAVMAHIAEVVEPGPVRDAVYARHFTWEISKLLRRDLPALPTADQDDLVSGVTAVYDLYDTPGLDAVLGPRTRVRLRLAEARELALLLRVVAYQARHPRPPLVIRQGVVYLWLPGFGTPAVEQRWYAFAPGQPHSYLATSIALTEVSLTADAVELTGRIALAEEPANGLRVAWLPTSPDARPPGPRSLVGRVDPPSHEVTATLTIGPPGDDATFTVRLPFPDIPRASGPPGDTWSSSRLRISLDEGVLDLPLGWTGPTLQRSVGSWHRGWRATLRPGRGKTLVLVAERLSVRRSVRVWAARRRRALATRLRSPQKTATQPTVPRSEQ